LETRGSEGNAEVPGPPEKTLVSGLRISYRHETLKAGVAQLVEHFLAKEDVARSNRVTRSILVESRFFKTNPSGWFFCFVGFSPTQDALSFLRLFSICIGPILWTSVDFLGVKLSFVAIHASPVASI
jgi:hypothetical protein